MKIYLFILLVIIFIISSDFANPMNFDSLKYKSIESIYYDLDSNIIFTENDSLVFEGYLVFKFNRYKQNLIEGNNSDNIMVESYWLTNLSNFNPTNKDFYLMTNYLLYSFYATQDEGEVLFDTNEVTLKYIDFLNSKEYVCFKKLFFKYYDFNNKENYYNIFLKYQLNTNIFDDSSVVFLNYNDIESVGYFIFKCSFSTAVLRYKSFYVKGKNESGNIIKEHLGFIKVLLPISKEKYFIPIDENEFLQKGFRKASWYPNVLYKK